MELVTSKTSELLNGARKLVSVELVDKDNVLKRMAIFSDLCSRMLDDIIEKRTIQERGLLDFSKSILWVVNNSEKELPDSFNRLYDYILDYWRYESNKEGDSERKYSYIRLYQMVSIIKTHHKECELRDKASQALEKYEDNTELLGLIQHSPGITRKKLRDMLSATSIELSEQIKPLEEDGFLSSRRFDEEQYYVLTNAGEVLCQSLNLKKRNGVLSNPWSAERIYVLCLVLIYQQKSNIGISQILEIVGEVAKYSEVLIQQILLKFKQREVDSYSLRVRKSLEEQFLIAESYYKSAPYLFIDDMETLISKKKFYYSKLSKAEFLIESGNIKKDKI